MDLTTQWVWLQRNKHHLGALIMAMVAFGAGWQISKMSTPYYEAAPIVFEDKECPSGGVSSGGSSEELKNLKEEGLAERRGGTKKAEASKSPSVASVAGAVIEAPQPNSENPLIMTNGKKFV